jgi:serralysin
VAADASGIGTDITIGAAPPPPSSTPPTVTPPPAPSSTPPAVTPAPPSSTLPAAIAAFDTTTNQPLGVVGQVYAGPVIGLQNEYINITSDSLNIGVTTDNWFIHSGAGTDAIAAHGGTNVLDGGTGSNFLTGGSGTDTFFVDDRDPTADIWSTVVGFHAGDAATIWGVTPQDFGLSWVDGQGEAGFTGLTLHATAAGKPTASLTLAACSQADMASGRISVSFGNDPASGSSYMYVHGNG